MCNLLAKENVDSLFYSFVLDLLIHGHIVSLIKSPQMTKSRSVSFNAYSSKFNYAKENRHMLLDEDGLVSRGLVHFSSFLIL